jgi:hypothetical protein
MLTHPSICLDAMALGVHLLVLLLQLVCNA